MTLANSYDSIIGKMDLLEVVLTDILGDDIADLYVVEVIAINET